MWASAVRTRLYYSVIIVSFKVTYAGTFLKVQWTFYWKLFFLTLYWIPEGDSVLVLNTLVLLIIFISLSDIFIPLLLDWSILNIIY